MPDTGGYLVSPRRIASIAACFTLSGVSKSGSPTESEMMSRPSALRSRAFCVTAIVAEGFTRDKVSAMNAMMFPILGFEARHHRVEPCGRQPESHSPRSIFPTALEFPQC